MGKGEGGGGRGRGKREGRSGRGKREGEVGGGKGEGEDGGGGGGGEGRKSCLPNTTYTRYELSQAEHLYMYHKALYMYHKALYMYHKVLYMYHKPNTYLHMVLYGSLEVNLPCPACSDCKTARCAMHAACRLKGCQRSIISSVYMLNHFTHKVVSVCISVRLVVHV